MNTQNTAGLTKAEIITGFEQLGLKNGDVVLVHSEEVGGVGSREWAVSWEKVEGWRGSFYERSL